MTTIQLRRGTAAQWAAVDPVLADGEPGFETDTQLCRVGDGVTVFTALPAFLSTTAVDAAIDAAVADAVAALPGPATTGLSLRGEWNAGVNYRIGDLVRCANQLYVAARASYGADPRADKSFVLVDKTMNTPTYTTSSYAYGLTVFEVAEQITVRGFAAHRSHNTPDVREVTNAKLATWDGVTTAQSYDGLGGVGTGTEVLATLVAPFLQSTALDVMGELSQDVTLVTGQKYILATESSVSGTKYASSVATASYTGKILPLTRGMTGGSSTSTSITVVGVLPFALFEAVVPWEHMSGLEAVSDLSAPDDDTIPTTQAVATAINAVDVLPDASALPDGQTAIVTGGTWVAVDPETLTLTSPDGTKFALSVDDAGILTATAI